MSSTAKTSTDAKMDVDDQKKKQIHALGVLEEDDEFEEFPAQGMAIPYMLSSLVRKSPLLADWEDRDTDIANLTNTSSGGAKSSADNLWEDNWDDDDVEDDFSKQLREEVAKQQASRSSEPQPMTH
ncbi:hypothetical protein RHS03_09229, partial [Rhizoctonia solani]